jgi:hypothetical protein
MSWPATVLRQFARVPAASEAHFQLAPYNVLLYTLFPPNTDFIVAPRWPSSSSPESMFMYEVLYGSGPVLVLQPNAPGNLRYRSMRDASDRQIRDRMTKLSGRYYPSHRIY